MHFLNNTSTLFGNLVSSNCSIDITRAGFKNPKIIKISCSSPKNCELLFKSINSDSQFIRTYVPYA